MIGLLFLWVGLGGGIGGCLVGIVWVRFGVVVVLVLVGVVGSVLGVGEGGIEEWIVFVRFEVVVVVVGVVVVAAVEVEEMDFVVLLEEVVFFVCFLFVSWEEDKGFLGGSKGCLGVFLGSDFVLELGWFLVEFV